MRLLLSALLMVACHPAAADAAIRTIRSDRPGYYTAVSRYPQFSEPSPLTRVANHALAKWAVKGQRQFTRESQAAFRDHGKPETLYEYKVEPAVTDYSASRLISVRFNLVEYMGGAHPSNADVVFNFGVIDGRVKRLSLHDLFTSGAAVDRRISDLVIRKLKRNKEALWVINGSVTKLTRVQLDNVSISPDGLTFLLNPYEAGPYSSGSFEVKLSLAELGPDFRRALIAGRGARLPIPAGTTLSAAPFTPTPLALRLTAGLTRH